MSKTGSKTDLKVAIPPSTEPPCECMMCAILKDLTKEENTSLPCLRRIPTRYLVRGGILSRKGQQSPVELPAGIPAEFLSQLRAELPADVPVELPAKLPVETVVELPAPVPVELPDNDVQPIPQEIDGIPISVVLLLRQIYKEEEKRVSQDASSPQDVKEPESASTTCSDSGDLPEPKVRLSINQLIGEGKPQEWPHEIDDLLCNVGNVEQKATIVPPTQKLAEPQKAEIRNAGYIAFSPEYARPTPGSPYPPTSGSYLPYRPWFARTVEDSPRIFEASSVPNSDCLPHADNPTSSNMSRVRFGSMISNDRGGWTNIYRAEVPGNHGLAHDHEKNGPLAGVKQFILSIIIHDDESEDYGHNRHNTYVCWLLPRYPDRVRIYRALKPYNRPDVPQIMTATDVPQGIMSMDMLVPYTVLEECEATEIIFEWEAADTVMPIRQEIFLPFDVEWPLKIWMYHPER